jgi:integrase/recombinase XerD
MQSRSIPSVTLYIRITDEKGNRRYERVNRRNPQLNGGVYCLHFYENGKRKWATVGTDINAALEVRMTKESKLLSRPVEAKPSPAAPKSLEDLRTAFIHDKKTTFKKDGSPLDPDTITHYEKVTRVFLDTIQQKMPSQVTKQDLKDWIASQRLRVSHRTVCNLYISVVCFLHFCGVDHKKLLPQSERPTAVEETPEAYTPEEMTRFFFNIVNERDTLAFEFLLKTGAREREMTELEWSSLNLGTTPTVRFGSGTFRTKTGKSRVVPLERELTTKLAAWRGKHPATRLVFGTDDRVEGHYLRICKAIAERAGMDQKNFWLHKFRDTFATWALRRGVDIRTVQHWLGHADITMTQRYLAPEQGEHAQRQINQAFNINFEIAKKAAV